MTSTELSRAELVQILIDTVRDALLHYSALWTAEENAKQALAAPTAKPAPMHLEMDTRVVLLVDVDGLGMAGETGDIIGVHPGCGAATYTVRLDARGEDGELRCNGCAPDEIRAENKGAK